MNRTFLLTVALLGLLSALLVGCSDDSASAVACPTFQTQTIDPILFASDNLYSVSEDGARFTQLTSVEKNVLVGNPRWSPDRTIIAYSLTKLSPGTDNTFQIEAQKLCGFNLTTGQSSELSAGLADGQWLTRASWSGDSQHVVGFLEQTGEPLKVVNYTIGDQSAQPIDLGADSSSVLPLVAPSAHTAALAYVVIQSNDQHESASQLVIRPGNGGEPHTLDLSANGLDLTAAPRWSPDGSALVLISQAQPATESQVQENVMPVSVSKHLQNTSVWIYDVKTRQLQPVMQDIDTSQIDWSPDGKQLIYSDGQQGGIYTFDLATKTTRKLTDRGDHGEISWGS